MSGFEVAAAAIGVADFTIRSIITFYDYVKELQGAPDEIAIARQETQATIKCFAGLEFLQTASKEVVDEVKKVGLVSAMDQCGTACANLEKDLKGWTAGGVDAIRSKFRFVRHKAKVNKYITQISMAKGTVMLALSFAHFALAMKDKSVTEAQKKSSTEALQAEISRLTVLAKTQRDDAEIRIAELEKLVANDDADAEMAQKEVVESKKASEQLWASCNVAEREARSLAKIHIEVGQMSAQVNSTNQATIPQAVLDKVEQLEMKVGNMTAHYNGHNRVGIFP